MKEPDTFGIYLREIGRLPLLGRAEEQDCARRTARGDEAAKRSLVQANLRFVVYLARRHCGRGATLQELVSAGNLGLIRAAERFDPDRNCRFITYAAWWIRRAIREAIDDGTRWTASAPGHTTGCSMGRVAAAARPVSLDAPCSTGDGALLDRLADINTPSPEHEAVERATRERVRSAVGRLPKRQALVLEHRYGLNGARALATEELARLVGVTDTRIRQMERRALARLRHMAGPSLVA